MRSIPLFLMFLLACSANLVPKDQQPDTGATGAPTSPEDTGPNDTPGDDSGEPPLPPDDTGPNDPPGDDSGPPPLPPEDTGPDDTLGDDSGEPPPEDTDGPVITDADEDGYTALEGDCDEADDMVHPGAVEICDGIDNDCDGSVDGSDALDVIVGYLDADGDGHGDADSPIIACTLPDTAALDGMDCDEADAMVHPGAVEICDGIDNDCDGSVDGSDALDVIVGYLDADGDGHGDADSPIIACTLPDTAALDGMDCDDSSADASPSLVEDCSDSIDNDCDSKIDGADADCEDEGGFVVSGPDDGFPEEEPPFVPPTVSDKDGDGYMGLGFGGEDCVDTNADVHPGAPAQSVERPRGGFDYDCDGEETQVYVDIVGTCLTGFFGDCHGDGGWSRHLPACGESGVIHEVCGLDLNPMSATAGLCVWTESRTQTQECS
jgi:hypothetical protein